MTAWAEDLNANVHAIADPDHAGRIGSRGHRILRKSNSCTGHSLVLGAITVGEITVGGVGRRSDRHSHRNSQKAALKGQIHLELLVTCCTMQQHLLLDCNTRYRDYCIVTGRMHYVNSHR